MIQKTSNIYTLKPVMKLVFMVHLVLMISYTLINVKGFFIYSSLTVYHLYTMSASLLILLAGYCFILEPAFSPCQSYLLQPGEYISLFMVCIGQGYESIAGIYPAKRITGKDRWIFCYCYQQILPIEFLVCKKPCRNKDYLFFMRNIKNIHR